MADPRESFETPDDAISDSNLKSTDAVQPAPARDPILEELLRSKSSDDDDGSSSARKKNAKQKKSKTVRTGTSLDKKSKKSKLPLISGIAVAALILGGGGTALWLNLSPGSSQIDPDRNKDRTQAAGTKQSVPSDEVDAPWNSADGLVYPIALDSWQTVPSTEGLSPESETALLTTLLGSDLSTSAGALLSEESGFTSDDALAVSEDGFPNPLYSFWTKESFTIDAGQIIEKFLNPRFGSWESYQGRGFDPNGIDPAVLFPNTFTDDALKNAEPVASWLPIHADWSNNNYGRGDLSATGPRWYGQVEDALSEFVWDDSTGQYDVAFKANVKFTAYKSNGEKVSEKGVLTLNFVANPGGERGSGGKVLVDRSSLTIGG